MEQNDSTDESVKKARYRIILAVLIFAVGVAFLVWGLCQQGHDARNGISTAVMLGGFFFLQHRDDPVAAQAGISSC